MPFRPSPIALALLLTFGTLAAVQAADLPARSYHIAPMPLELSLIHI